MVDFAQNQFHAMEALNALMEAIPMLAALADSTEKEALDHWALAGKLRGMMAVEVALLGGLVEVAFDQELAHPLVAYDQYRKDASGTVG
jgi:hypothetical protein